ncbi:hypothetical protein RIF29_06533 [Crotalaria pallida]|uniref:non-specific serine/threonine protein kinase n=1 Tax=Crotalaria pallida TaxID=3830 RepID=A0AAN9PBL2_CROPI
MFLITILPVSNSQEHTKYLGCNRSFKCGGLNSNISYPFWADGDVVIRPRFCGGRDEFKLNCETQTPSITIGSEEFHVFDINMNNYTINMIKIWLLDELCDPYSTNYTLNTTFFDYVQNLSNITLFYNCPHDVSFVNNFTCPTTYANQGQVFCANDGQIQRYPELHRCKNHSQIQAIDPLKDDDAGILQLKNTLGNGFEVKYKVDDAENCKACRDSNGACGRSDSDGYKFSCHCQDGSESSSKCSSMSLLSSHLFT